MRKLDDNRSGVIRNEAGMLLLAGRRRTMDNRSYHDEIWVSAYGGKTNEGQTRRLSIVTKGDQILWCNVWYAGGAFSL